MLDAAERTAKTSAAALASAKAALITAEDNLKHCVIAAPMDGRMSFTNYSAGNYVTAAVQQARPSPHWCPCPPFESVQRFR